MFLSACLFVAQLLFFAKKRLLPSTTATPLLPGTRLEAAATTCLVACSPNMGGGGGVCHQRTRIRRIRKGWWW